MSITLHSMRFLSLCAFLGAALPLSAAERYHLVKAEDHLGVETLQVLSQSEIATAQAEIREEGRYYMLAIARANAKWRQEGRKENFPKTSIQLPRLTPTTGFASKAEAEEKLSRLESRDKDGKDDKKKDDKKKKDNDKDKEKEKAKELKEQEKERFMKEALGYYQTELDALKAEAKQAEDSKKPASTP